MIALVLAAEGLSAITLPLVIGPWSDSFQVRRGAEGIGLLTGPLLAGAAIGVLSGHLDDTRGYQALWPILGVPVLLAIPLVWRLRGAERRRDAPDGSWRDARSA